MVAAISVFVLFMELTWSGYAIMHRGRGGGKHKHKGPEEGPIVNLSPEERKKKHDEEYVEFEVNINMTRAHQTGQRLGIVFDSFNDWEAPEIVSMRKPSLMEEWNKQNPDKAVHLHDRIVKVNHILFHHNANAFIERIVGQFTASRKMVPGAKDVMTLLVQREKKQQVEKRFLYQREDLHDKLYSKEFNVPLVVPEDETSPKTMNSVLGWELNVTQIWNPVSVGKIVDGGLLAQWNEAHPSDMILVGDEILHVNKRHWLHNTTLFLNHLAFNYEHRFALQSNGSYVLGLRRPRWVQEAFDESQERKAEAAAQEAEAAAKEAEARAKFEDDLLRIAPDIEDAVRYWNKAFSHDQIVLNNKSMAEAVAALQAEGWDYASSNTSLPKALAAEAENPSDATSGLDESDYLTEAAKTTAMEKAADAQRLAAPNATSGQDESEDVIGAEGDSAPEDVPEAAAAAPSSPAEKEKPSDATSGEDESDEVIGAEGDSSPEEPAAAAAPSAPAESEKSSDEIAGQHDVIGAEGDSAPKEPVAAAEPSAPADAEKSSGATGGLDESDYATGAEGDSAPEEPAAAAEPAASAELEKPADMAQHKDEDAVGAGEGSDADGSDEMVLGDEA